MGLLVVRPFFLRSVMSRTLLDSLLLWVCLRHVVSTICAATFQVFSCFRDFLSNFEAPSETLQSLPTFFYLVGLLLGCVQKPPFQLHFDCPGFFESYHF